jgi:hypothetical protein
MSDWNQYDFLLYGLLISLILILIWIGYAFWYRTSIERLSKLASQKYLKISSDDENARYVAQADPVLSNYDSKANKFRAVIVRKPDMNHPNAPPLSNVVMTFDIAYSDEECGGADDPVRFIRCINVN